MAGGEIRTAQLAHQLNRQRGHMPLLMEHSLPRSVSAWLSIYVQLYIPTGMYAGMYACIVTAALCSIFLRETVQKRSRPSDLVYNCLHTWR